jgi:hypothetical protein
MIEVHGSGRSPHDEVELLKLFGHYGYYLFSYEINGFHLPLCEFSFIHETCMHKYGVEIVLGSIF